MAETRAPRLGWGRVADYLFGRNALIGVMQKMQVDHLLAFDHAEAQSLIRFEAYDFHDKSNSRSTEGADYIEAAET